MGEKEQSEEVPEEAPQALEPVAKTPKVSRSDPAFEKLAGLLTGKVSSFVAFLFFIVTIGMILGFMVANRFVNISPGLIVVPAALGLLTYYSRDYALLFFVLLLIGFLLF